MSFKRVAAFLVALLCSILLLAACSGSIQTDVSPDQYATVSPEDDRTAPDENETSETSPNDVLDENGSYTSKEDVSLYIFDYGKLPHNFITKTEARLLGWSGGSLMDYAPGKCIGGDRFGNYEHLLPEKDGRTYYECDIDTRDAASRGAKRIVYSNDGLIYYTDDHYESFTLLYGDENE